MASRSPPPVDHEDSEAMERLMAPVKARGELGDLVPINQTSSPGRAYENTGSVAMETAAAAQRDEPFDIMMATFPDSSQPSNGFDQTDAHNNAQLLADLLDGSGQMPVANLDTPDWVIEFPNLTPSSFGHSLHETSHDFDLDWSIDDPGVSGQMRVPFAFGAQELPGSNNHNHDINPSSSSRPSSPGPDDGADYVISRVSDTKGSLQDFDSELRYFGPTSNITLLSEQSSLGRQGTLSKRRDHLQGHALIRAAGLDHYVDPDLIQHLVDLYFAWQDSAFHVVDRDIYEEDCCLSARPKPDSACCSESLMNIICAFGSLYETDQHPGLPSSLSEFFAEKARIWLEVELDKPRLATVQALTILSSYEAAQARDGRGWLYSGMAMRLSMDLGLHLDMSSYVQSGRVSAREAEARKVAFWGSFIIDRHWGLYLGRPLFRIASEEISAAKPAEMISNPFHRPWKPHGLETGIPIEISQGPVDPFKLVARSWIWLCEIMGTLAPAMYEDRGIPLEPSKQAMLEDSLAKLSAWEENALPMIST